MKYSTTSELPSKETLQLCHAPSVVEHMAIWVPFSLQRNMMLPLLYTPPFIDPIFPGDAAVIPPNSTGPQIVAIEQQFNKALRQWTEYKISLTLARNSFKMALMTCTKKASLTGMSALPTSQSERYWNSCFKIMGTSLNMTLKTMINN